MQPLKTLARTLGRLSLALALVLGAASLASHAAPADAPKAERPWVLFIELVSSINPGSGGHFLEAIHDAEERGAEALIVRLDTPGGLLSTTRDLVQAELSAKVPVVVWIGPPGARAGSAGVFLTLAANVAAMAPSTNIGAAHPVGLGGGKKAKDKDDKSDDSKSSDDEVMAAKIENDTAAFVTGIAERRKRNVEWAEQAVRDSVSITASKALELKVVDLLAEDLPELLQKLDGRQVSLAPGETRTLHTAGAEVRRATYSVKHQVLNFLADPEIAWLIAMLGVLGILAELYHPGTIVPGVVGVICLLIAAVAFQMIPINAGALALVGLGVLLIGLELFLGGHGWFIGAGGVCLVVGSLLLVGHVGGGFWADKDFGIGWRLVAPVALALCVIMFTLVTKVSKVAARAQTTGASVLLGLVGEVREPLGADGGQVMVNGELWRARSDLPLAAGERARVVGVEGLTVRVVREGTLPE